MPLRLSTLLEGVDLYLLAIFAAVGLFALVWAFSAFRTTQVRRNLSISHDPGSVRASGFDKIGENVEIGPVTLDQARALVEQRCEFVTKTPGTDDNAEHSGVMFYRSDDDWIGLYARTPDSLDLDVSLSLKQSLGHKLTAVSRNAAEHWVSLYFRGPAEFASGFAVHSNFREPVS